MTEMHNIEKYPDGTPIVNKPVRIALWSIPAYSGESSFEAVTEVVTDETGLWTLDLAPTSTLLPLGEVYIAEVRFRGGSIQHLFTVPDSGPAWIGDYLSDPPGTLPSSALSLHEVDPTAHGGGGSGAVTSVNTRLGNVVGLAENTDLQAEVTNRTNADTNHLTNGVHALPQPPIIGSTSNTAAAGNHGHTADSSKVDIAGHATNTMPAAIGGTSLADKTAAQVKTFLAISESDITSLVADLASKVNITGSTSTGEQVAPSVKVTGKTGATDTSITLAGGTTSGAPTSGAHIKGELVLDDTGAAWYCTVAGTPGTWVQSGGGGGSGSTAGELPFTFNPAGASIGGNTTLGNTGGRLAFTRARGSGTISKIALVVRTQGANIEVGIARNAAAGPGAPATRVATSGSVACPSAGYAEISLGGFYTIDPTRDYFFWGSNTDAIVLAGAYSTSVSAPGWWASRSYYQDGTFPCGLSIAPVLYNISQAILAGIA